MGTTTALEIRGVKKRFGEIEALKGVDLAIGKGESFGLLGPNGAGKSTLIGIIAGIVTPDEGEVTLLGRPATRFDAALKKNMGVVPQEISLYDDLTARENLDFYGKLYGLGGARLSRKIDEALGLVGLSDRQKDRIKGYSGGMKRRINIAASILHEPEILLLDEPTVGIDPQSRNLIFEVIESLNGRGVTVIYTTHYMEEAERLCTRIGIIDLGRVIALGTHDELVALVGGKDRIEVETSEEPGEAINKLNGRFSEMHPQAGEEAVVLTTEGGAAKLAEIVRVFTDSGIGVTSVHLKEPGLETVFLTLTGKELRDA
jgi:ABC-2 type transport system ATP-binding protein